MATIVVHVPTGQKYILLGSGALKPSRPAPVLAVADVEGAIGWFPYDALRVVSVDGKTLHAIFTEENYR